MIKLAQLQLQYMQYKLEEKVEAEQAVEDETLAIAVGLSSLAAPSLGDIHAGLGALEGDIKQLGSSRVDGLIEQVRGCTSTERYATYKCNGKAIAAVESTKEICNKCKGKAIAAYQNIWDGIATQGRTQPPLPSGSVCP